MYGNQGRYSSLMFWYWAATLWENKIRFVYFYLVEKTFNNIFNTETLKQHVPTYSKDMFKKSKPEVLT